LSSTNDENTAATLSVIVPLCNEEAVLPKLFDRLYPALDGLGAPYDLVFVDDGSRDRSPTLLHQQHKLRPDVTRVVLLRGSVGQHAAILAGFEVSEGDRVVTLDSGLQNPPEEIRNLLAEMDRGHDYVGGIRRKRRDARWRELASRVMNGVRERITRVRMTDPGCILRAYDREIVDAILASREAPRSIPAQAQLYAVNPTEILVGQEEHAAETPEDPLYKLIRSDFDLVTGLSLEPLKIFSLVGMAVSLLSFLLCIYLAIRRLMVGPEMGGVFTLLGILFFLAGVVLFGVALVGAYVGRLLERSGGRPPYLVRTHLRPSREGAKRKV
jgi:undecaprenyl-phosphate 4-deoxy-4-formamido-L-arabinose transferase